MVSNSNHKVNQVMKQKQNVTLIKINKLYSTPFVLKTFSTKEISSIIKSI